MAVAAAATGFGEPDCDFDIVGTWRAAAPDGADQYRYRFAPDGTVTALSPAESGQSAEFREFARATYVLDDPKAPKQIHFQGGEDAALAFGATPMEITAYDDASLTGARPGARPVRWVRAEAYRYFLVLGARSGTFYDGSGPGFPMLIKTDGRQTQVDAVGTYSVDGKRRFGTVPPEAYEEFMREPRSPSDVMLRLEVARPQYERGLKIVKTWERRAREGALLYSKRSNLDNVVLAKTVVESLNRCGPRIELYPLNWLHDEDALTEKYPPKEIPFQYFKELRRRNESLHVADPKFQEAISGPLTNLTTAEAR